MKNSRTPMVRIRGRLGCATGKQSCEGIREGSVQVSLMGQWEGWQPEPGREVPSIHTGREGGERTHEQMNAPEENHGQLNH